MTSADLAAMVGCRVAFLVPMDGNSIVENTFYKCGTPVSLWGYSFNTTVVGNVARETQTSAFTGMKTALAVSALAGLASSSHSASSGTYGSQCCIPSFTREYGNDWGDGNSVYQGIAYSNEANAVTGVTMPMPAFSSSNSVGQLLLNWAQSPFWVAASAVPFAIAAGGVGVKTLIGGWMAGEVGTFSPSSVILNSGPSSILDQYTDTSSITTASGGTVATSGLRGRLALAAGGTSVVISNPNINVNSQLVLAIATNDATAAIKNYVCAAGGATINLAATAAITKIDWVILK